MPLPRPYSVEPALERGSVVHAPDYYSASDRGAEYCNKRVCLSVCVYVCLSTIISSELHVRPLAYHFLCMLPGYGRGSVLLWRRSDMLCTSGFMDDVIICS